MSLTIDDPEVEALARELAQCTGETPEQALAVALRERLERDDARIEERVAAVMAIGRHFATLPVLDARSPDELLDYDEHGLPR